LKPGLKSVFQFVLLCYPRARHLQLLDKFFDEIYAMFNLLLENHYLKRYSASFSENFYGMKRVLSNGCANPFKSFSRRFRSLIFLVLMPYLSEKLDTLRDRIANSAPHRRTWFSHMLIRVYPHLKTLIMVVCLLFQVSYTFSYNPVPSPFLWLADVRLERLNAEDIEAFEAMPLHLKQSGFLSKIWRLLVSFPSILGRLFSYGLFFCQFMEYFYTDSLSKQLLSANMGQQVGQQSAPPHPLKAVPENYVLNMDVGKCPLCFRTRENDTALSVSGYVFCYACINEFVRREKRCPITSLPASPNELVKIYQSTLPSE